MIRTLGGDDYLKTSPSIGTNSAQLMRGVETYINEAGYTIEELSVQGAVDAGYRAGNRPDLGDIKPRFQGRSQRGVAQRGLVHRADEDSVAICARR